MAQGLSYGLKLFLPLFKLDSNFYLVTCIFCSSFVGEATQATGNLNRINLVRDEAERDKGIAEGRPFAVRARAWREPTYEDQENTLGYQLGVFDIPATLQPRVEFWKDIYIKYSSEQGVIHDIDDPDLIYGVTDFSEISSRTDLSSNAIEKAKLNMLDEHRERILNNLRSLRMKLKKEGEKNLTQGELELWQKFARRGMLSKLDSITSYTLRWQQGLRDQMEEALYISGRYLPKMEEIFKKNHLPRELTRIVFVESLFNLKAVSKVGASGLWQIMPRTARPFRMIHPSWDLRNHPEVATHFAAQILKDNYRMLNSWPLAITGYNHGPSGIRKLVRELRSRDLVKLIRRAKNGGNFGFASKNFYSCFLAVLEIEKNAKQYFPNIKVASPLTEKKLSLNKEITFDNLMRWFGNDESLFQLHNPHINFRRVRNFNKIPAKAPIAVPQEIYVKLSKKDRKFLLSQQNLAHITK